MGVALYEQETVINFMRNIDIAQIYTTDNTVMNKLDKLVENPDAPDWQLESSHFDQKGNLVGKTYTAKKKLISFRRVIPTVAMSEERKEELRERLQQYRMSKSAAVDTSDSGRDG